MYNNKLRAAILAALSVQAVVVVRDVSAQAAQGGESGLEEIIVTSTRRETNVQDVPVAITALSAASLTVKNIENLQDLTSIVPNVLVRGGPQDTNSANINMRGIPNVGIYVDGIWQVSSAGLLLRPFADLDRVEVLRGPQGTLYGRDSTGGSIHLFSKRPSDQFGGAVDVGLGSFARRDVSAAVDVPVTDKFHTKWFAGDYDQDGYVRSQLTGKSTGGFKDVVLRGDLLWEPTDRMTMRLIRQEDTITASPAKVINFIYPNVAWQDGTQVGIAEMFDIASQGRFNPRTAQSGAPGGLVGEFENRQKLEMPNRERLKQTSFQFDYDINDSLAVKYLYGNTDVLDARGTDYGGAEFNFFLDYSVLKTDLTSHEIQVNGNHDRIHWNAGAYFWDQNNRSRNTDYSAAEWVQAPNRGIAKTLDYNTVLASPACSATAASKGLNFAGARRFDGSIVGVANGPNSWITPCNGFFGRGIFDALTLFLTSGDEANDAGQDGDAYFGEFTVDFTDKWDMTFGVRHHQQTNTNFAVDVRPAITAGTAEVAPLIPGTEFTNFDWALGGRIATTGPRSLADPAATTSFDNTSYRFGTSYHIRDDLMVYFGYNEGFNSGGVSSFLDSAGNQRVNQFEPESIENTEIGVRADFLGKRLRLNATYFSTDWLGIQIQAQVIDPITGSVLTAVTTQNAAGGQAKGVDLELTYLASQSVTLGANLGFLDTGYTSVKGGLTEPYNLDTTFTGAPDETYDFWTQYDWKLRSGASMMLHASYAYTGFYERSSLLSFRQRSIIPARDPEGGDFWNLSLRVSFVPQDAKYELSLYGNNLTDEYNLNSGFMHRFWNFDFGTVDKSREYGLNFRVRF